MDVAVNVIMAKDGTEILEFCTKDKAYRMNSLYRPEAEAEKFAEQYSDMEQDAVLFVFGYGNGLFPKAIMRSCGENVKVVFYEPEKGVFQCHKAWCEEMDQVLGTQGYVVMPERIREGKPYYLTNEFPKLLEELIDYSNHKKVQYTALPKYRDVFPKQYGYFVEQICYRIERIGSNAATAKAMGHDAVVNNIKNLRYVLDSYCADSFLGAFPKNMPAIIVSAGPSLENNIHFLKQAKGRALILCVDSAVKYLLKENIIPDLLVSVDPLKPLVLFDDARINGIPVVGSLDMNYRVLEMLPDSRIIFASTENAYVQNLYKEAGHIIPQLKSGGSVATLAFSLCLYWGFQCIILTGQDLALTDNQMYAGASKLSKEHFRRELLEVEDIHGHIIYTVRDYYYYLKWFEQAVAMYPEVRVIDATEGGAKIAGTEIMTLKDALAEYDVQGFEMEACLKKSSPAFSGEKRGFVDKQIRDSRQMLYELQDKLETGITLSEKGLLLAGKRVNTPQAYLPIDTQMQEICDFYNTLDEGFLIQREIDAVDLDLFMKLFENMENLSLKEKYQRMRDYFMILQKAVRTVCGIWDELEM